jgi:hypothetical protein
MQREFDEQAHYETTDGDRVSLLRPDDEWMVLWSYANPHHNTQLIHFGSAGSEAIDTFVQSRHSRSQDEPLAFDSRTERVRGSI